MKAAQSGRGGVFDWDLGDPIIFDVLENWGDFPKYVELVWSAKETLDKKEVFPILSSFPSATFPKFPSINLNKSHDFSFGAVSSSKRVTAVRLPWYIQQSALTCPGVSNLWMGKHYIGGLPHW